MDSVTELAINMHQKKNHLIVDGKLLKVVGTNSYRIARLYRIQVTHLSFFRASRHMASSFIHSVADTYASITTLMSSGFT